VFRLAFIPLVVAAPLIALLAGLRVAAPLNPPLAGALAGPLAGALGAVLYATHCPDDSPLFAVVWDLLAIGFIAGLGALAGSRWLSR
jgi:hypothetical protein